MAKKKPQEISQELGYTSMQEAAEITSGIPMYQEAPITELTIPKTFKVGEMEVNKETLIAQRAKDVELIITGVDDTKGYKAANTLRGQYRTLRTTLEKYRKDLSKPHQEYVKQLKTATDELGAEALIGEQYFDQLMADIDSEKQRIKDEDAKQEQIRIQGRIKQLTDLGAKFDGENYYFTFSDEYISAVQVSEFKDGDIADFLVQVQSDYDVEQQRLEDERLKKIEDDRVAKELADAVALQATANKATEDALAAKQTKLRTKELALLGAVKQDDDTFLIKGKPGLHLSPLNYLLEYSDEEWERLIESIENYVVPEPEPVIVSDELYEAITYSSPENEGNGLLDAIASGNPVEQTQESYVTNEAGMVEEDDFLTRLDNGEIIDPVVEVLMSFTQNKQPYDDFNVSMKLKMRIWPDEYQDQAMAGVGSVGNSGKVQGLNWALIQK